MLEIVGAVVRTNGIVKMNEHLTFCKEFSTLCIEDSVVADRAVKL